MELIQTTNLWYNDYRSDKVYYAELCKIPTTNLWNINFVYGRRGGSLIRDTKNKFPLEYRSAKNIYEKLCDSKFKKGYGRSADIPVLVENNRYNIYFKFSNSLKKENLITEDEHQSIMKMLLSNDPETVKLAEVLIETKEKLRWEQN